MVSLVIIIVIMLILAGVSISFIIGNNGLFKKSNESVKKYEIASIKEQVKNDIEAEQIQDEDVKNITEKQLSDVLKIWNC